MKIFIRLFYSIIITSVLFYKAYTQTNYEIGTWYNFKDAAVTYSFDDNSANQTSIAIPMFDQYGYKATFNVVPNWGPNWNAFQAASNNGHEIASHTVSHATLGNISQNEQTTELANSQTTINNNISGANCITIAYPNCVTGDIGLISQYYIAGRICSNQIVSSSPNDFYNISSIICGDQTTINSADAFNGKVQEAQNSGGWCVFLLHGLDNDGGYSPTQSSALSSHLQYINNNDNTYWVETFATVVKYIKERNALSVTENEITQDSIEVIATDGLDNSIYNTAVTIRRPVPANWEGVNIYVNGSAETADIVQVNGNNYIQMNIVPDTDEVYISNSAAQPVEPTVISLHTGWNLVGYPYTDSTNIETAFENIWSNIEVIKDRDGYYYSGQAPQLNSLDYVKWGIGYFIKVDTDCELIWQ